MLKRLIPLSIRRQVRLLLHRGDRYLCPFCGYASKDLAPIGLDLPVLRERKVVGGGLRNGGCHNCGATDREKLLFTVLKEEFRVFDEPDKLEVLHIAPEKNLSELMLNAGFRRYECGDLFAEGYDYADHVQDMSVLNLPFPDQNFDLLLCNHVLEHIPDDTEAMKEILRVLRPNARAILQVPISKNTHETFEDFSVVDPKERERIFGQFDHIRIYGQDYPDRLRSIGFEVESMNVSAKYEQYGLNLDEDVFIAKRPEHHGS